MLFQNCFYFKITEKLTKSSREMRMLRKMFKNVEGLDRDNQMKVYVSDQTCFGHKREIFELVLKN